MVLRVSGALFCAAVLFAWPAVAEDQIVSRVVPPDTLVKPVSRLIFFYEGCEEECRMATLECMSAKHIRLTLAQVPSAETAKAITDGKQRMTVSIDNRNFEFFIQGMSFSDLDESWQIEGLLFDDGDFLEMLRDANRFDAKIQQTRAELPVDAPVKVFVKACMGR